MYINPPNRSSKSKNDYKLSSQMCKKDLLGAPDFIVH
jgi:hypothetical protein